jgi:hypothetical protein
MSTLTSTGTGGAREEPGRFPAYGPLDAVLGLVLFYYLLGRVTAEAAVVLPDVVADLSGADVRLAAAFFAWFVVAVTLLDQGYRQLAALGVVDGGRSRVDVVDRVVPTEAQALGSLVLVLLFGLLAALSFETGVDTAVAMVEIVARLDPGAFVVGDLVVMVVFFVSYAVATRALDRLVVGGLRELLAL